MKKYNAIIVEDIADTSEYIKQRLITLCPDLNPPDQAFDLEDAYKKICTKEYHIVFLDIQFPKGTGFDLLNRLSTQQKIQFEIIFITGESEKEYTLRAIKYSALDFLYKPLDDSELVLAVNKAIEKISTTYFNRQIRLLLDRVGEEHQPLTDKIAFHLINGIIEFVNVKEIKYMQADGVISHIYLDKGKKLTTTKNLGYYKEMLMTDYNFYLISNSLLVNQDFIKRYNHSELTLTLKDGTHLFASKRFGKAFKDSFRLKQPKVKNPFTLFFKRIFR